MNTILLDNEHSAATYFKFLSARMKIYKNKTFSTNEMIFVVAKNVVVLRNFNYDYDFRTNNKNVYLPVFLSRNIMNTYKL